MATSSVKLVEAGISDEPRATDAIAASSPAAPFSKPAKLLATVA
jgi:hypothetical protein